MRPHLPTAPFRLADLLERTDLGLELVVGGREARERRVSGVHSLEVRRPTRWLAPDWAMLTTGVRLVGDEAAQRALPAELAGAGVAALGLGCGIEFDTVPDPLLDAARAIDFPVFSVPLQTPFREIQAFVQRALLSSEMRELQRLSSMQRYLVDALYASDPRTTIVHRLSTLLESAVAVLTADGGVEAAIGGPPPLPVSALSDPVRGVRRVEVAGWRVLATPVAPDPDDRDGRWVVAARRGSSGGADRLTRAVLQAAAPLLAGVGRLDDGVRDQERAVRRALVDDLIRGAGDERSLAARAAACGIDLADPAVVLVAAAVPPPAGPSSGTGPSRRPALSSSPGSDALDRLERRIDERLAAHGGARLLGIDRGRVVALTTGGGGTLPDGVLDELVADGAAIVGVGRTGIGAPAVAEGVRDAHVAVEHVGRGAVAADAEAHGASGRTARGPRDGRGPEGEPSRDERGWRRYDDVDLPALVIGQVAAARIAPQVARIAAAIDSRPGLREALAAYLDHDQDVTAAAAALHLHPNSLRHRLGRLSDALGRPLRDPTVLATLVLVRELERRQAP